MTTHPHHIPPSAEAPCTTPNPGLRSSKPNKRRRPSRSKFQTAAGSEPVKDVYTRITDKIVADLEKGVRPWMRPWSATHTEGRIIKPLRHNGTPYAGINVLMLWMETVLKGYKSAIWMTFRQAQELSAHVRKGEHGSLVVYANTFTKTEQNDEGEDVEHEVPFLKGYTVFNVEQIEGLPEHYYAKPPLRLSTVERIDHAEAFVQSTGAIIRHGGNMAYYTQAADRIQMPPIEAFTNAESYYATLNHELTHWTQHPARLDRDFGRKKWGDEGYAVEELVAELGACFVCADLDIMPKAREENAAYIGHWLKVLKSDNRAIFTAASHAQRAAQYLHSLQPKPQPTAAPEHDPAPS